MRKKLFFLFFLLSTLFGSHAVIAKPFLVYGKIYQEDRSTPVRGALVTADVFSSNPAATDADGKFVLQLDEHKYHGGIKVRFKLSHLGEYQIDDPDNLYIPLPDVNQTDNLVIFYVRRINSPVKIFGYIQDVNGKPLGGVDVSIPDFEMHASSKQTDGEFVLRVPQDKLNQTVKIKTYSNDYSYKEIDYTIIKDSKAIPIVLHKLNNSGDKPLLGMTTQTENKTSIIGSLIKQVGSPYYWFMQATAFSSEQKDIRKSHVSYENVDVIRNYRSTKKDYLTTLGYGWQTNFKSRIDLSKSSLSKIVYHDASGKEIEFNPIMENSEFTSFIHGHFPEINKDTSFKAITNNPLLEKKIFEQLYPISYVAGDLGLLTIKIIPKGFILKSNSTESSFNQRGDLEGIEEIGKPSINILYDVLNRMVGVSNLQHYVTFNYNQRNLMNKIQYEDSTEYYYAYDDQDLLTRVTNNFNNDTLKYTYDPLNKTLVGIDNSADTAKMKISYNKAFQRKSIELKNYSVTNWEFEDNDSISIIKRFSYNMSPNKYLVDSILYAFNKHTLSLFRYNYNEGSGGFYYLTPCACTPLLFIDNITDKDYYLHSNTDTTKYDSVITKIDNFGNVVESRSKRRLIKMHVDPDVLKIDTAAEYSTKHNKLIQLFIYKYDYARNLVYTKDSLNNEYIELAYDSSQRISVMKTFTLDKNLKPTLKSSFWFRYNNNDKPIIIGEGKNKVTFTYKPDGSVDKVDSDGEEGIASVIIRGLQKLIDFTALAGDDLSNSSYRDISDYPKPGGEKNN